MNEALNVLEGEEWRIALKKELSSLQEKNIWKPVRAPSDVRVMDTKFFFTKKYNPDGEIERYKARLAVKGFQQE